MASHPHSEHPAPGRADVLYVACSQAGLAPAPSDFLLAIDLRSGVEHRALGELHLGGEDEQLRCVEWLAADRSALLVLGTGSSQLYVVDVETDPALPALATTLPADAIRAATGCAGPLAAVALPDDRAVVALGAGGEHDLGGLATVRRDDVRRLGDDVAEGRISDLAVAADGELVVGLCATAAGAVLVVWDGDTGAVRARGALPHAARALVASPSEPGGFLACAGGALLRWRLDGPGLSFEQVGAQPTGGEAPSLALSRDGSRLYVGDWLAGTLGSYAVGTDGRVAEVDSLVLGGRLQPTGDAEGARWDEMIVRGGRAALAGPANLTLSPDDGHLVVTNGAWADAERGAYPTYCSWLVVVDCREDGRMEVDFDRVMTIVNRPRGPARYGTTRTSWRA